MWTYSHATLCRRQRRKQLLSASPTSSPKPWSPSACQHLQASNIPLLSAQAQKHLQPFTTGLGPGYAPEPNDTSWLSQPLAADLNTIMAAHDASHLHFQYSDLKGIQNNDLYMGMQLNQESGDSNSDVPISNTGSVSPDYTLGADSSNWDYDFPLTTAPSAPSMLRGQPRITYDQETKPSFPGKGGHEPATPPPPSSISEVPIVVEKAKTVLTVENLDAGTRAEILDLLFKRKLVTTIGIA